jgi:DNA-binding beta-propeller fold protein YncE
LTLPFAFCVDLPAKASSTTEQRFSWSLAISRDGSRLYAVNPALRTVSALTTNDPPVVVGTASLPLRPRAGSIASPVLDVQAKAAHLGGAALSADGRTLFAVSDAGLLSVDTGSLRSRSLWLKGGWLDSIAMSSDGAWLFAAHADSNTLLQVNPSTGAFSQVPGVQHPWAVFWAEPE